MPPSPFRYPSWLLLAGFAPALVGACLDQRPPTIPFSIEQWHLRYCTAWIVLLALGDREGPWRGRALVALGAWIGSLAYAWLMFAAMGHHPFGVVFPLVLRSPAPYVWALALWSAAPMLAPGAARRYGAFARWSVAALCLYGALCFASAVASRHPAKYSIGDFYSERAVCLALAFSWLRAALASRLFRVRTSAFALMLLGSLMAIGLGIAVVYQVSGPTVRQRIETLEFVRVEEGASNAALPEQRLQFPLRHFNRTAYAGLLTLMALLLASRSAARSAEGRRERWAARAALGCAPIAFAVIVLSYTRTGVLAALVGLCVWAALSSRRALAAIAIGGIAVAVALPATQRNHLLSPFRAATYIAEPGQPLSSMGQRLLAWRWAAGEVRQSPLTGLGYGIHIVRHYYTLHVMESESPDSRLVAQFDAGHRMQHMHNAWIETAVESGLPAALALLAFTLLRWGALARAVRMSGPERSRAVAWIAFEVAVMLFFMNFYMLRNNSGFLAWFVWTYAIADLSAQRPEALPEATC